MSMWNFGSAPHGMRARARIAATLILLAAAAPAALAQDGGKLVAPLYPGAVTVTESHESICTPTAKYHWSVCSQYAKDPIDKVRAFYDQKVGGKRFLANRTADGEVIQWAPLAWNHSLGEDGEADNFPGVTLRARVAPPWPAGGSQQIYSAMQNTAHFGGFLEAVDLTGGGTPVSAGMRPVQALKDLYAKQSFLEARYFADPEAVRTLREKYKEDLRKKLEALKQQEEKDSQAMEANMMRSMQQMVAQSQARQQEVASGGNKEEQAERAEMEALMKRKPALWAKAKPHYDRGRAVMDEAMAAMQSGKDYPESKLKQAETDMKTANDIMRSDPEVRALQDKQMAAADARAKASTSKAMQGMPSTASFQDAQVQAAKKRSDTIWNHWTAYLAEVAKLPSYPTRVEVSHARAGDGKDWSSKPDDVAAKAQKVLAHMEFEAGYSARAYREEKDRQKGDTVTAAASGKDGKKDKKPEKEEKKSKADEAKESAKKAGEEGLKMLKKLF